MPDKVIETTRGDSIKQAMVIWGNIKELDEDASTSKALLESELSQLTWIDCNSEADFERRKDHYQWLNDKVRERINQEARSMGFEHPILTRHNNRIGRMTKALGHKEVEWRVKCAGTHVKKGIGVNEGLNLGRQVTREFAENVTTKLIEDGYDPKYAAQLATDIALEIKHSQAIESKIGHMGKDRLLKGIANEVLDVLSNKPAIKANDERLKKLGIKDVLTEMSEKK